MRILQKGDVQPSPTPTRSHCAAELTTFAILGACSCTDNAGLSFEKKNQSEL